MITDSLTFAHDGASVFVHRFRPAEGPEASEPRAVLLIAHGMAEHGARYARFADVATARGLVVYACDHRGHGRTAQAGGLRGHFGDHEGWGAMVGDLRALTEKLRADHPGKPLFLFAHSMGSFLALDALSRGGAAPWDRVVLSGSDAVGGPLVVLGRQVAKLERIRVGAQGTSRLLTKLSFGSFNDAFRPTRTEFDWLSRDPAEVDKYVADPWCGFDVTTQSWIDFLAALSAMGRRGYGAITPKSLPVLLVAGSKDPVGKAGEGVRKLARLLRAGGLTDVTETIYPDGRHEMLNETNRAEVTEAVLRFFEAGLGAPSRPSAGHA